MNMTYEENDHARLAKIGAVTVWQPRSFKSDRAWMEAEITWPGSGSANPDKAEDLADDLLKAAKIARQWNDERAGKP